MDQKRYIKLYADEFDADVWASYCAACGKSAEATELTIWFDESDVKTDLDEED